MGKQSKDDRAETDEFGQVPSPSSSASHKQLKHPKEFATTNSKEATLPAYVIEGHTPYPFEGTPTSTPAYLSPQEEQSWFKTITARSSELIQVLIPHENGSFRVRFVNDGLSIVLGYQARAFYYMSDTDFVHPDDLLYVRAALARCVASAEAREILEYRGRHADGSWRHLESYAVNCMDDPVIGGILLTTRDVTESRERENHLLGRIAWYAALLNQATDALRVIRVDGQVQVASGRLTWLLGDHTNGLDQEAILRRTHPEDQKRVHEGISHALQTPGERVRLEFRARSPQDEWRYIELELLNSIHDMLIQGIIVTGRDLTSRKLFDPNTRLPSRTLFLDRVERLLQLRQHGNGEEFAVLVVELDRFGKVHDGLGAAVSERLLKIMGSRLTVSVRPSDYVGRMDRDKFIILLNNLRSPADVSHICEVIHDSAEQPCFLEGHKVFTTVTIGVAFSNSNFATAKEMLQSAETAMHRGRQKGGNRTEMFDPAIGEEVRNRLQLEGSLRHAIDRQEFLIHYQPIVALSTRQLVGFEALCRWRRAGQGFISPAEFIPIAEESGMINTLGEWVLSRACESAARWSLNTKRPPFISINLSGRQLTDRQIVNKIEAILQRTRLAPNRLKLEITETSLINNPDEVAETLDALRALGIRLSLDDFGTGYSSLSYLHRFPFHTIKIDKSFVSMFGKDRESAAIVPTIIQLAQSLKMDVIAEGVETEEQARWLQQLGCPFGQGYLFAKALPEERLNSVLSLDNLRSFKV